MRLRKTRDEPPVARVLGLASGGRESRSGLVRDRVIILVLLGLCVFMAILLVREVGEAPAHRDLKRLQGLAPYLHLDGEGLLHLDATGPPLIVGHCETDPRVLVPLGSVSVALCEDIYLVAGDITLKQNVTSGDLYAIQGSGPGATRLYTYYARQRLQAIGPQTLSDAYGDLSAFPPGTTIFTGEPFTATFHNVITSSRFRLGRDTLMYRARLRDLPQVTGALITNADNSQAYFQPDAAKPGVLINYPTTETIVDNWDASAIVGGTLVVETVEEVTRYSAVNSDDTAFRDAARHIVLRSYQNGLHAGAYGNYLDYAVFPVPPTCQATLDWSQSLYFILVDAASNVEGAQQDILSRFATPSYYFLLDDTPCSGGGGAAYQIPVTVTFHFYTEATCSAQPAVASLNVDLRRASSGSFQLMCAPIHLPS